MGQKGDSFSASAYGVFIKFFVSSILLSLIIRAFLGFEIAVIFIICWFMGLVCFNFYLLFASLKIRSGETFETVDRPNKEVQETNNNKKWL